MNNFFDKESEIDKITTTIKAGQIPRILAEKINNHTTKKTI